MNIDYFLKIEKLEIQLLDINKPQVFDEFTESINQLFSNISSEHSNLSSTENESLKRLMAKTITTDIPGDAKKISSLKHSCAEIFKKINENEDNPVFINLDGMPPLYFSKNDLSEKSGLLKHFIELAPAGVADSKFVDHESMKSIQLDFNGFLGLEVLDEPLDKEDITKLLEYLEKGTIDITSENVFRVIEIAKYFQVKTLIEKCTKFLLYTKSLREVIHFGERLPQILRACVSYPPITDLFPRCLGLLAFVDHLKNDIKFNEIHINGYSYDDSKLKEIAKTLWEISKKTPEIDFVDELVELTIININSEINIFSEDRLNSVINALNEINKMIKKWFPDSHIPELKINSVSMYNELKEEDVPALTKLFDLNPNFKKVNLIESTDIDEIVMLDLFKKLKNLRSLHLSSSTITFLPEELTRSLQDVSFRCPNLVSLTLPNAEKVICDDCINLINLEVPVTMAVSANRTKITSLSAPKALRVYCNNCVDLTSLEAPKATDISYKNTKLENKE